MSELSSAVHRILDAVVKKKCPMPINPPFSITATARFVKPVPAEREIRREVARKPVAAPALPPVVPLVAERRIKLKLKEDD